MYFFSRCQKVGSTKLLVENFHSSFSKWWFLNLFSFLVPSVVKNIHVSPNGATDSLTVNWTPGGGDVDSYTVSAFRQNQKVESQTVPKLVSEHTFHRLEAGEQYRIVIASVSGSQKNQVDALGRTGKRPPGEGPNSSPWWDDGWAWPLTTGKYPNSKPLSSHNSMWFREPFSYFFSLHVCFWIEWFKNRWKVSRNEIMWIDFYTC